MESKEQAKVQKRNLTKKRYRHWRWTEYDIKWDSEEFYNKYKDVVRYIGYGVESCPDTGRNHLQGWIQFYSSRSKRQILAMRKWCWVGGNDGQEHHQETYCKKEGNNYVNHGRFAVQGARTDLENAMKDIREGMRELDRMNEQPMTYARYGRFMDKYAAAIERDKAQKEWHREVEVELVSGPTDKGKTYNAMKNNKDAFKIQGGELQWFDGYEGQKTLIIDEYSNDNKVTKMLSLLDRYALRLPVKGSFTYARWNKVVITTNLKIHELHPECKVEHRKALMRRIKTITSLW